MRIAIVDYGMGNIRSVYSTLKYLGVDEVTFSSDEQSLVAADKIILPGVGSFAMAMKRIREKGLEPVLNELAIQQQRPLLGICLGMQLMGSFSPEDGDTAGLNFVEGTLAKFADTGLSIPHVGFNQVSTVAGSRLYAGLPAQPDFYFVHSYRMQTDADINASFCSYGENFVASFEKDNLAGVQFHPELSQQNGLHLLKNFIDRF